jgi:hypothetical protein
MEGGEGDDIAVGQRRHLLVTGYDPLQRLGPRREKTALDETLHVYVEDVRAATRLHEDAGTEGWELYQQRRSEGKEP